MADTLRIKRRPSTGAAGPPATLAAAEIAYNEKDDTLYYGKGDDGGGIATNVIPIAGPGFGMVIASCSISDTPPSNPKLGDFWFESDSAVLFVWIDDGSSRQWVAVSPTIGAQGPQGITGAVGPQGPPGMCTISDTPPSNPSEGQFWFESDLGIMWIWVVDANSSQWVQYSGGGVPTLVEAPLDGKQYARQNSAWSPVAGTVSISDTPPANPLSGQQWFRSDTGVMYVRYPDADGSQWVVTSQPGPAGPQGPPGQWTQLTQAQYNALAPPNPNTLYVIIG